MNTSRLHDGTKKGRAVKDRRGKGAERGGAAPLDPATALEDLRTRLVEVEALANATSRMADRLPLVRRRDRRYVARLQALVIVTASVAEAALGEADEMVACLSGRGLGRAR
jgi:hypothetical protein